MKKVFSINESELFDFIQIITESEDVETFENEDYVEVFVIVFRNWIKEKFGEQISKYPLSYLFKRYEKEFYEDKNLPEQRSSSWNRFDAMAKTGKELVKKKLYSLSSLRPLEKFTEKYKNGLKFFVDDLNLPSYMEITLHEEKPYELTLQTKINFPEMITYKGETKNISPYTIQDNLRKRFEDFLGVEFGNSIHGELEFNHNNIEYIGVDEWTKNVLNKDLKIKIRQLDPKKSILHSIKFSLDKNNVRAELKLGYKSHYYSSRYEFKNKVKELLGSLGYNTNLLKVTD